MLNQALEKLTRQITVVEKDIKELTEKIENDNKEAENGGDVKVSWVRIEKFWKFKKWLFIFFSRIFD